MPQLAEIKIPRIVLDKNQATIDVVGFADASGLAYAAVVYLRVVTNTGQVKIHMLRSTTRLCPISQVQTIPKFELCACGLLVRILNSMSFLYKKLQIGSTYLFTDSSLLL